VREIEQVLPCKM